MKNMIQRKNKKGFTLVELVIVIAVLAILAAVAVPTVTNVISEANDSADAANAQTIELALKTAYAESTANTWSTYDPDDLTVAQALLHEGILDKDGKLPPCKVSDHEWYYDSGKIISATTGSAALTDSDGKPKNLKVEDVLDIAA